jgi:flagellar M-ring protein FliF
MASWLSSIVDQVRALPPARRMALAASAAGSLAFFAWISVAMNGEDYRLLYRGFEPDEAAQVVEVLKAEKVPYRLDEGGGAIFVPAPLVYEARLVVAGKGLPRGGSPGLELFDAPGFGVSDFVNQVNYQRALQGELARSIEHLAGVERARVQIAAPQQRGYVAARSQKPSASVVVALHPGAELDEQQVRGIVHLVASSVPGLAPDQVTLVDQRGHLLAPQAGDALGPTAPAGSLAHQERLERELAERVESILGHTVGAGAVVARVRADLDWTQTESTEERFDPESQVARSERISNETSQDGSLLPAGIPGIASNAPAGVGGASAGGAGRSESRSTETINYEISKTVSRTVAPMGTVKRLDVAVLIDQGSPTAGEGGFDDSALREFEDLAKHAIGFSAERGDRIVVRTAPFHSIDLGGEEERDPFAPEVLLLAATALRFLGILAAILLFARLVAAPLLARLATPGAPGALPVRAGDLELQLAGAAPGMALPRGAAAQSPAAMPRTASDSVQTLRGWLKES